MNAAKDSVGFFSDEHGLMRELLEDCECRESNPLRRAEHVTEAVEEGDIEPGVGDRPTSLG
jgi:hypothetical protein